MVTRTTLTAALLAGATLASVAGASADTLIKQQVIGKDGLGDQISRTRFVKTDDLGDRVSGFRVTKTDAFGDKISKSVVFKSNGFGGGEVIKTQVINNTNGF